MIDIHSHILYGIDDGSRSIDESMSMIRSMCHLGFTKMIATPHYMENTTYVANNKRKKEIKVELEKRIQEEQLPMELYLGNEIFIEEDIINKILSHDICSLNGNNYLLVEIPMFAKLSRDTDILFDLIEKGATVILAHPERYTFFQKDPTLVDKYLEMGVLFQGNIDSFAGKYGREAKKLFIHLLKNRKYFALASDIHRDTSFFFTHFWKVKKEIIKIAGEEYFWKLMEENPRKILERQ